MTDSDDPLVDASPRLTWDGPVGRWSSRPPAPIPDEVLIARLVGDLRAVSSAAAADTIGYDGFFATTSLADLLHAIRVTLVNPASNEARSLMRAIARYDAALQPLVPDPDTGAVPASGRPCNLAALHNPEHCDAPGCTGGRRAA
jgi:hypothetical protein